MMFLFRSLIFAILSDLIAGPPLLGHGFSSFSVTYMKGTRKQVTDFFYFP